MSIRAMNWALDQRTDGPSAQSVLFVIADSANEHGITFHCNPDYIAEKTRQSRGTVFRRMAELEEVGGLERVSHHKNDGRRLYEVRLNLAAKLNYKIRKDGTIEHLTDDGIPLVPDGEEGECQIETQGGGESQIDTQGESRVIHPESHSCNSQDSIDSSVKNPKIPAPTPSKEGVLKNQPQISEAARQRFQEFKAAYPDGIVDLDKAEKEFLGIPDADQEACVTAAPVYAARCRKRREKSKKAHLFIRERAWVGLLATENKTSGVTQYPASTPAGTALLQLGRMARYRPLQFTNGNVAFRGEITPALLMLATAPPEIHWLRYERGSPNFAAWRDMIYRVFAGCALPEISQVYAPWPWPPTVDGKTYAGTDPPPGELSDADVEALTVT